MNKKLILLCLVLVMALGMFSLPVAADTIASGSCGATDEDNVTWSVSDDGVLTISGSGKMQDATSTAAANCPWGAYRSEITSIVIEDGITHLGGYCFASIQNVTSITVPDTVATVGNGVFYGCSALTEVDLPDAIPSLGNNFFGSCTALTKVKIPKDVTTLGTQVFYNCSALKEVEWPDHLSAIPGYCFYNCTSLASLTLPDGITQIGTFAFQSSALTEIDIPGSVESINQAAFVNVPLTKITFHEGLETLGVSAFQGTKAENVLLPESLTSLGNQAFSNCASLKKVYIGENVTSFAEKNYNAVFNNCSALEEIDVSSDNPSYTSVDGILYNKDATEIRLVPLGKSGAVTIPATMTVLPNNAFQNCAKITSVTLPDTLTSIGNYGFYNCTALETVNFPAALTSIGNYALAGSGLKNVELNLPDGFTLGSSVFQNCKSLETVKITGDLSVLPNYTFYSCEALKTVTLPDGLTSIGSYAFQRCSTLNNLVLPASLEELNPEAFGRNDALTDLVLENENFIVENQMVFNVDKTKLILVLGGKEGTLKVPAGVTEIGNRAVALCSNIEKVSIANTVETIGAYAFLESAKIESLTIPRPVKTIGEMAFGYMSALSKITIANSVTDLGSNLFYGDINLTTVKLPGNLKTIPDGMFNGCSALATLTVPDTVTTIGQNAFNGCSALSEIRLPSGISSIGQAAFNNNTSLKSVVIPEGVETLSNNLFYGCSGMESITLPDTLTTVGTNALLFYGFNNPNNKTAKVYFSGTPDQWYDYNIQAQISGYLDVEFLYGVEGTAPVITEQPQNITIKQGQISDSSLSVAVAAPDDDSEVSITWFTNTSASHVGLTKVTDGVTVAPDGLSSTVVPITNTVGTKYYIAIVTMRNEDGEAGYAYSDFGRVAVTLGQFEGEGNEESPYLVSDLEDLQKIQTIVNNRQADTIANAWFRMTDDIEIPADWVPIGRYTTSNSRFKSVFDGGGHTITVADGGNPLFGFVETCTIQNLNIYGEHIVGSGLINNYAYYDRAFSVTIDHVTIKSGSNIEGAGLFSGAASSTCPAHITNCTVEKDVKIGWNPDVQRPTGAGGSFAGAMSGGTVYNCVSYADVYSLGVCGGIVAMQGQSMSRLRVTNCEFHGTVNSTGDFVGGIVGKGYSDETAPNGTCVSIINCIVTGDVNGNNYVGGIFGGEGGVKQAWANGIGTIQSNAFYGNVRATAENGVTGGIVGYLCGINVNNALENNYYREGCGATNPVGDITYIDSSATGKERGWDEDKTHYYFNSSVDSPQDIKADINPDDQWNLFPESNLNIDFDPFGEGSEKMGQSMTAEEFKDGTVLELLNNGAGSFHNWKQLDNYPVHSDEAVPYQLEVSGDYKTKFEIGEELDLSGIELTCIWSDNSETHPSLDEVEITGYDNTKRALETLTLNYQGVIAQIEISVINPVVSNEITVYFTLLGDEIHDADEDENYHLYETDTLTTWIERTEVKVDGNATVLDLFDKVLSENGYSYSNPKGNYIKAITTPDGLTLAEFTNGANSGWMFTYNRKHVQNSVIQQFLNDGDEIVFHYTDDYKQEEIAENVAKQVEKLIDDIGEVTLDSEEAIVAAREAYEALSDKEKAIVANLDVLEAAEEAYAALKGESDKIKNVEDLIAAIGEVTADSGEAIAAAREAYDALSNSEKDQVANAEDLRKAESAFAKLSPFVDVSPDDYFFEAVKWALANDVTKGTDETHFSPAKNCSRGQVVTFLWRAAGMPEAEGDNPFSDVTEKDYFYDAVLWAVENEITTGSGEGKFSPNGNCTRGQVATFLWRAAGSPAAAGDNPFTDVTESDYFYDAVLWAVDQEITKGTSATAFSPNAICTRGQVVTFLYRAQ